jgi:hypothetical protein
MKRPIVEKQNIAPSIKPAATNGVATIAFPSCFFILKIQMNFLQC